MASLSSSIKGKALRAVLRKISLRRDLLKKRFKKQDGLCAICGLKMFKPFVNGPPSLKATLDHIIPLSKGGLDHWENVQAVHHKCNQEKGNKLPTDK